MRNERELRQAYHEAKLGTTLLPSAMPRLEYTHAIAFPTNLRHLQILDIGTGQSDTVSWLNSEGAVAYGVDLRYKDRKQLDVDTDIALQSIYQQFFRDKPKRWQSYYERVNTARKNFKWHIHLNRNNYIAALAGYLPFRDEVFDFVFSIDCITKGLDTDYELFSHAISEALRVLKKSGELQLYPFPWNRDARSKRNSMRLLTEMQGPTVENVGDGNTRLRIKKS